MFKKINILLLLLVVISYTAIFAGPGIGFTEGQWVGTADSDLDMGPYEIKGLKVSSNTPTIPYPLANTTTRNALASPSHGEGIFNVDSNTIDIYTGSAWRAMRSLNTVYVNDVSDLPADRVLLVNTKYDLTNSVIVSSIPFTLPSDGACYLQEGFIIYTGTGAAIRLNATTVDTRKLEQIAFQCTNPNSSIYNITASGGGIGAALFLDNVGSASFDGINPGAYDIGTIEFMSVVILENGYFNVETDGLKINNSPGGTINNFRIAMSTNASGPLLSFGGAFIGKLTINAYIPIINNGQCAVNFSSTTAFDGVNYYGGGVVYQGTTTVACIFEEGSFDNTSLGFKFATNQDIPDSTAEIKLSMTNNLTVTTFTAVNVPALVSGIWEVGSERFEGDPLTGRAKYTGLEDTKIDVFANPTAVTGVGTNKDVSFYFAYGNEITRAITSFADAGGGQVTVTSTGTILNENGNPLQDGDRVVIKNTSSYNGTFIATNTTTTTFEITDTFVSTETGDWAIIIEDSIAQNQLGSTTKASNTAVATLLTMVTNDYVELFIENNTDDQSLRVKNANLILSR